MTSKRTATVLALATAIAIPAEGLRQYAYYDPVGILTICYGDTNNVKPGQYATVQECKARLDEEMIDAIETIERCLPNLPDNVLAAFSDAAYNIGPRIACDANRSTAARLLKAGRYEEACRQLPRWDKAGGITLPGLTKRRAKEMELCLS